MGPGDSGGRVLIMYSIYGVCGRGEAVENMEFLTLIAKSSNIHTIGTMKYMYKPSEQYKLAC